MSLHFPLNPTPPHHLPSPFLLSYDIPLYKSKPLPNSPLYYPLSHLLIPQILLPPPLFTNTLSSTKSPISLPIIYLLDPPIHFLAIYFSVLTLLLLWTHLPIQHHQQFPYHLILFPIINFNHSPSFLLSHIIPHPYAHIYNTSSSTPISFWPLLPFLEDNNSSPFSTYFPLKFQNPPKYLTSKILTLGTTFFIKFRFIFQEL